MLSSLQPCLEAFLSAAWAADFVRPALFEASFRAFAPSFSCFAFFLRSFSAWSLSSSSWRFLSSSSRAFASRSSSFLLCSSAAFRWLGGTYAPPAGLLPVAAGFLSASRPLLVLRSGSAAGLRSCLWDSASSIRFLWDGGTYFPPAAALDAGAFSSPLPSESAFLRPVASLPLAGPFFAVPTVSHSPPSPSPPAPSSSSSPAAPASFFFFHGGVLARASALPFDSSRAAIGLAAPKGSARGLWLFSSSPREAGVRSCSPGIGLLRGFRLSLGRSDCCGLSSSRPHSVDRPPRSLRNPPPPPPNPRRSPPSRSSLRPMPPRQSESFPACVSSAPPPRRPKPPPPFSPPPPPPKRRPPSSSRRSLENQSPVSARLSPWSRSRRKPPLPPSLPPPRHSFCSVRLSSKSRKPPLPLPLPKSLPSLCVGN
mmetsp:Transcript_75889/g.236216  ORF Transcript_75889/g.236216 Transcript_75889/m.236216 type:complete len:425 (+) Transcript_75889:728-2002(+)